MTLPAAPASPQAFRRSLNDRIKQAAKIGRRHHQQLQRQFLLQRFLGRVFAVTDGPWILKGGTGLLIRLPGARHSKDIDLLHADGDVGEALAELRALAGARIAGDPFTFVLGEPQAMSGGVTGTRVPVSVYLGTLKFDGFTIDLSTDLHIVAAIERVRPVPIVEMPGLPPLPEFTLYPLPDQIADKACAMYECHGDQQIPSSRYRDLVDLLLIITSFPLDAALVARALTAESRRRQLTLPTTMTTPGPDWNRGYRDTARDSTLDPSLHELSTALDHAGICLNPLLASHITVGTWNHTTSTWENPVAPS